MDAVLMAAGLGTRLRPHTLKTPKPMLLVRGRPILDWIVGALPASVDRLVVVVHYLAEQVEDYLHRQKRFKEWVTVPQIEPRGTGDALRRCHPHIVQMMLVLNGDDLFGSKDLAELATRPAGVLVHDVDEPRRFGIVFLKADGSLEKLIEKPDLPGPQPANTGAYVFPRSVFDIQIGLSPRGEYEITDFVSTLAQKQPFHVVQSAFWMPIGTEEAWNKAQQLPLEELVGTGTAASYDK